MQWATLSDVAKLANVSKMTVSRVINHPEKVTDELKELVYQAMKELDYHPNIAAKALVRNRSQIIKLFILEEIDTTEPYYMNLLMGIARAVGKEHYSLQLVTKDGFDTGAVMGTLSQAFEPMISSGLTAWKNQSFYLARIIRALISLTVTISMELK